MVPIFESYFSIFSCRVSDAYYSANRQLAQTSMLVFAKYNIPYWLDYATLLADLRQAPITIWDHDVDLSMIHPDYIEKLQKSKVPLLSTPTVSPDTQYLTPITSVLALKHVFAKEGLETTWDGSRDLFQIWSDKRHSGPHIDVWLWKPAHNLQQAHEGPYAPETHAALQFSSADHTIRYNMRTYKDLFPLVNSTWLDMTVLRPRDSHHLSFEEYKVYGGNYMTPQVFRGDCFHNFFSLRFMW